MNFLPLIYGVRENSLTYLHLQNLWLIFFVCYSYHGERNKKGKVRLLNTSTTQAVLAKDMYITHQGCYYTCESYLRI